MKTHHKLVLTLASLALSLTIPACGGGGGGDDSGSSGSDYNSDSSDSYYASNLAPSSINGKTLECKYTKGMYDLYGVYYSADHVETLTFSGSQVTWVHTTNGIVKFRATGSYTYSKNSSKGTVNITKMTVTSGDWDGKSSVWTLNFHYSGMGVPTVTVNGNSYINGWAFTLK